MHGPFTMGRYLGNVFGKIQVHLYHIVCLCELGCLGFPNITLIIVIASYIREGKLAGVLVKCCMCYRIANYVYRG